MIIQLIIPNFRNTKVAQLLYSIQFCEKELNMPPLSIIGAGLSLASNLYGGIQSANAMREKQKQVDDYQTGVDSWYDVTKNQDFLDTNVARSMLTQAGERVKNSNAVADKMQATTGGTDEATLAQKTANAQSYNDVVTRLAGMGTARQDQADSRYMGLSQNILGMQNALQDQKLAGAQTLQQNSGEALNSIMSVLSML